MKRMNIMVDEELLEKARLATGERTYSGAVNKALAEMVRVTELERMLKEFARRNKGGAMFNRSYVEEHFPESAARLWPDKGRISANEVREPKKVKRRGTR